MVDQKKSRFGLGLLIGTIIGGITALFVAPKSGKEMREDLAKKAAALKKLLEEKEIDKKVKEVFEVVTEETKNIYLKAKEWLIEELAQLKEAVDKINWEDYQKSVDKVIVRVKKETKKGAKEVEKLKKQLLDEWKKLKK